MTTLAEMHRRDRRRAELEAEVERLRAALERCIEDGQRTQSRGEGMTYKHCDEWLYESENYSLRIERIPDGSLPWIREAWRLGVKAEQERAALTSPQDGGPLTPSKRGGHE